MRYIGSIKILCSKKGVDMCNVNFIRGLKFVVFSAVLAAGFALSAADESGENKARVADHKALQALGERTAKMLNEQNFKEMQSCFAKRFVFIPIDQSVITSVDGFKEYYRKIATDNDYGVTGMKITPSYDTPTVFTGDDTGYCYGTADNTFILKGGKSVHIKSRWSADFVKEDGKWKIAMVQSGVNMLDNPMLSAVREGAEIQMKISGAVIILLVALVIYLLLHRKRMEAVKSENVDNATT